MSSSTVSRSRQLADAAARRREVVDFYLQDHSLQQTGLKFGITRERVRQILNQEGVFQRNGHGPQLKQARKRLEERKGDVMRAYEGGKSMRDIARETGTMLRLVEEFISEEASQMQKRRRKTLRSGEHYKYSEQRIIEILNLAAVECGGHLSAVKYDQWRLGRDNPVPTSLSVQRRFGSWNKALAAAGLSVRKTPTPDGFGAKGYSDEEILNAIARVAGIVGGPPTIDVYSQLRSDTEPSAGTARNRFGSWVSALELVEVGPAASV